MEPVATFYSRHREKCLAYQHAYNAAHKEQRKAYDHARYLKKKEARQKAQTPAVQGVIIEQNVRVGFH
jgi:hypothetical protein